MEDKKITNKIQLNVQNQQFNKQQIQKGNILITNVNISQSQKSEILKNNLQQNQYNKNPKIIELRKWMIQKGCIIHNSVQIPSMINGVQGVLAKESIPAKTLIIAIPSSLVLTVQKCYKSPELKSVFVKNQELFDYQDSQDAQFNILCTFLMYHKLNIQKSQWKVYLQTIGQPQTAVDWDNKLLKGLNKSMIQQVLHIRIQCDKLKDQLCGYLKTTQQFQKIQLQELKDCFNYCYRAVMTRCFGYYFNQVTMIPVADLINHGCQVVDHQLIHTKFEKKIDFYEGYQEKSQKIDLSLLGIKKGSNIQLPFREKFLVKNNLVPQTQQYLQKLNRRKIDQIINNFNQRLFHSSKQISIDDLQFNQQDDQQDNDTDQEQQQNRQIQLERLKNQQLEQIQNFKKYFQAVKIQKYKDVKERYKKMQEEIGQKSENKNQSFNSRQNTFINNISNNKEKSNQAQDIGQNIQQNKNQQIQAINLQPQIKDFQLKTHHQNNENYTSNSIHVNQINQQSNCSKQQSTQLNSQSCQKTQINPLKLDSSSEEQSQSQQDDQKWGLQPQAYFTMSTSSAVQKGKQLFNSYGSRTNKFLLVWYGFCYRDNLYDSITLRLHVKFSKTLQQPKNIVLDTYIAGQGLISFRKNQTQIVKCNQVSKQFRIKRSGISLKLITFLRLYLLDYYRGKDLYKICITIPSSLEFQNFLIDYYQKLVDALYQRFPLYIIEQLYQDIKSTNYTQSQKVKINFKIIYLQQQRKILDQHSDMIKCIKKFLLNLKQLKQKQPQIGLKQMPRELYEQFTIIQLRKMKSYLKVFKENFSYVLYEK